MATKRMYTCPECQIQVKDLKGHTARKHKEPGTAPEPKTTDPETLEILTPEPETPNAQGGYHCVSCGETVSHNQKSCQCGVDLDWGAL